MRLGTKTHDAVREGVYYQVRFCQSGGSCSNRAR